MTGPEPLKLTTARWFNAVRRYRNFPHGEWAEKPVKKPAFDGHLTQFAYGTDTPSSWNRRDLQRCSILAPHTGLLVVDVDYPGQFATTRTARLVGREHAWSTRGERCHIPVDYRSIPPDQWPKQGPIAGGDIKSNGWVPVPGSWHYSGERYEPTGLPLEAITRCTPELASAILADREDMKDKGGNGGSGGSGDGHDSEVSAKTKGMIIRRLRAGWPVGPELMENVYAEWLTVAIPHDPSDPFTRDDFERHYGDESGGGLEDALKDFTAEAAWWQRYGPGLVAWAAAANRGAANLPRNRQPRKPGTRERRSPKRGWCK